jgi:hypothetical protein
MTPTDASWASRTAAAREANRGKPMRSGGPTTVRAIRVPDETWRAAQDVAIASGTTVSAMVVEFLEHAGNPTIVGVPFEAQSEPAKDFVRVPGRKYRKKFNGTQVQPLAEKVTPENCKHLVLKELPLGTFCRECGTKMAVES